MATLTTVPLPSPYGTIEFDGDGRVSRFREKPRLGDYAINGGFFVFDQAVFESWEGEDLERDVLPALGAAGLLYAYAARWLLEVDGHLQGRARTECARF